MNRAYWGRFHEEVFKGDYDIGITKDHYDVVVDIGANVGSFSEYIYDKADVIYALEPLKENFDELVRRTKDKPKIKPFNIGIDAKRGTVPFDTETESMDWGNKNTTIEVISLKEFIEQEGIKKIDLLKIDCEGCEKYCFNDDFGHIGIPITDIVGEQHMSFDASTLVRFGYEVKNGSIFTAQKI